MSYITAQDIIDAYGANLLRKISGAPPNTQPDPVIVQRGIDSADNIIDAFVGARYTLPLNTVPGVIQECAIDIAVYKIPLEQAQRTVEMRTRYDDALALLKQISSGAISLGLSPADLASNGDAEDPRTKLSRSVNTYLG